jgi:hypothetical protein
MNYYYGDNKYEQDYKDNNNEYDDDEEDDGDSYYEDERKGNEEKYNEYNDEKYNEKYNNAKYSPFFSEEKSDFPSSSLSMSLRRSHISPYIGYHDDEQYAITEYTTKMKIKAKDNHVPWVAINYHEYKALMFSTDFKEGLAERYYQARIQRKIILNIYQSWKLYCGRFTFLRLDLLKFFLIKKLRKRFFGWFVITRKSFLLKKSIRQYWRKIRRLRFNLWKFQTKWLRRKIYSFQLIFPRLKHVARIARNNRRKWQNMIFYTRFIEPTVIIRRLCRSFLCRLRFWAAKKIKRFFMLRHGIWIVTRRKRIEIRRLKYEKESLKILVIRAIGQLERYLISEEGKVAKLLYFQGISQAMRAKSYDELPVIKKNTKVEHIIINTYLPRNDNSKSFQIFPTTYEMPKLITAWTQNRKSMIIVEERCKFEVRRLARQKFRSTSKPIYDCMACGEIFVLRILKYCHHKHCKQLNRVYKGYQIVEPNYIAWNLSQEIIDPALQPLASQLMRLDRNKKRLLLPKSILPKTI